MVRIYDDSLHLFPKVKILGSEKNFPGNFSRENYEMRYKSRGPMWTPELILDHGEFLN